MKKLINKGFRETILQSRNDQMFLHVRLPLVTWAQESLQYFPKSLTEKEWSEPLYRNPLKFTILVPRPSS